MSGKVRGERERTKCDEGRVGSVWREGRGERGQCVTRENGQGVERGKRKERAECDERKRGKCVTRGERAARGEGRKEREERV